MSFRIVVPDELHKAPKWKNLLKGVADEFHTVSTSLRYYHDRLKPQQSVQLVQELARPMERSGVSIHQFR